MGLFDTPENLIPRKQAPLAPPRPARGRPRKAPDEQAQITLKHVHKVNGVWYHGTVTVPKDLAAVLLENDQRAEDTERNFNRTDRAVLIGPGRVIRELPGHYYDTFDTMLGTSEPSASVSGHGMTDPGAGPKF
jgi:hypothetical protein